MHYNIEWLCIMICFIKVVVAQIQPSIYTLEFPPGFWDATYCNNGKTLRNLMSQCYDSIDANSPLEQKLACAILSQPNTAGSFPFGMYPPSMPLDEELQRISETSLTKIFGDCALPKFIQAGCIDFEMSTNEPTHEETILTSFDDFMNHGSSYIFAKPGAEFNVGFFTAGAAHADMQSKAWGTSFYSQAGRSTSTWQADIGILTLTDKCFTPETLTQEGVLYKPYFDLWANFEVKTIVRSGFVFPTKFAFATRYASTVTTIYSKLEASANYKKTIKNALTTSMDAGVFGTTISAETVSKVEENFAASGVASRSYGADLRYGNCDFGRFKFDNWQNEFSDCVGNERTFFLQSLDHGYIPRAAYIPPAGFMPITDLVSALSLPIPDYFANEAKSLTAFCNCESNSTIQCYSSGELIATHIIEDGYCDLNFWYMESDLKPFFSQYVQNSIVSISHDTYLFPPFVLKSQDLMSTLAIQQDLSYFSCGIALGFADPCEEIFAVNASTGGIVQLKQDICTAVPTNDPQIVRESNVVNVYQGGGFYLGLMNDGQLCTLSKSEYSYQRCQCLDMFQCFI